MMRNTSCSDVLCGVLVVAEDAEEDYVNDNDYDGDTDPGDEDEDEEAYTGPPPIIRSLARDLSVMPGETARFPCEVEHSSGTYLETWSSCI